MLWYHHMKLFTSYGFIKEAEVLPYLRLAFVSMVPVKTGLSPFLSCTLRFCVFKSQNHKVEVKNKWGDLLAWWSTK